MVTVAEVLSIGVRHQQAGQLAEAERAYRRALEIDSQNAHALHLLGTVAMQARRYEQAIELIGAAIRRDRSQPVFHAALGEAYRLAGDLEQAATHIKNALRMHPQMAGAHISLAQVYWQQGNCTAAADCYRQVVKILPDDAGARLSLGRILKQMGKPAEAEACFRRVVRIAPDSCPAHDSLGLALVDLGKLDEARASFETALAIKPDDASAHNNLGTALKAMYLPREAEAHFREAIRLDPKMPAAHNNLGAVLLDDALYSEALASLTRAIELDPRSLQTLCNLARVFDELGRFDDAVASARKIIEIDPGYSYGHCNLATSLKNLGHLDESIESYRKAIRLNPQCERQRSALLFALNLHAGYEPGEIAAEHRQWGRVHADALTAASRPHANDRTPARRLRVGYVSGHFWAHAVNFFTEPILAAHDHSAVEVFCYSCAAHADETTRRVQPYADHWRDISQQGNEQASQLVRADQIDILVDLAGHIAGNRLLVFARKPAPVQVTYIGYQNTTGMAAMDYRLTDAWADPPGATDDYYTEKLVRLPRCFFCYQPSADAPPPGPLPLHANGHVTFGSFNNFAKVTPDVLASWARILQATPGARLVILANTVPSHVEYVRRTLASHGIGAERVTLADRRPRDEYLKLIQQVDIALDPFPFNGHTTTCDALWQGVPVVTLAGRMYANRFGASAHVNLGLENLVARSADEYVEIAARLAGDVQRLTALRSGLRARMAASPLLDFAGFTRNLETAYRRMWTDWCAGGAQ